MMPSRRAPAMSKATSHGVRNNFLLHYLSAFLYPIRGMGLLLLFLGTVSFCAVTTFLHIFSLGRLGAIILLLIVAYGIACLMKVIQATVGGEDELPDWPDVTAPQGEIAHYCLLFVGTLAFCALPLLGLWMARAAWGLEISPCTPAIVALPCVLYAPMGLLSVVVMDSLAGLNPLHVIPSILRIPIPYLMACGALWLAGSLPWTLLYYIPGPWFMRYPAGVLLVLYSLTVQARLIGLISWANRKKLGWLKP